MSPASINNASFWANQVSVLSAPRMMTAATTWAAGGGPAAGTTVASGGGGLFANLLSTLSAKVATNGGAANGSNAATSSRAQIAQDFQAFTQSLLQTLASNPSLQAQGGSSLSSPSVTSTGAGASMSSPGIGGAAGGAGTASARGYGHGHGGLRSKLESLMSALNNSGSASTSAGTPDVAANKNVANLNAAFNKLMADLGASGSSSSAASAVSNPNADTALHGLLQGMLQHLQQQGSLAASAGHVVHVVA
jgi:hypothetical protein